jgi:hypothetical protein
MKKTQKLSADGADFVLADGSWRVGERLDLSLKNCHPLNRKNCPAHIFDIFVS